MTEWPRKIISHVENTKVKKIKILDLIRPQIFEEFNSVGWIHVIFGPKMCSKIVFFWSKNSKFVVYFLSKPEILTKSAGEPPINLIPGFGWTNFRLRILWIFVKFSTTISYWINHFSVHLLHLDGFLCPAEIINWNVLGLIFHWKNIWFYVDLMNRFFG